MVAIPIEPHTSGMCPFRAVSYTHLDVYKRQMDGKIDDFIKAYLMEFSSQES